MTSYNITSRSTGHDFGTFQAETTWGAVEAYARDAGYQSFAALCGALGLTEDEATDDIRVTEAV